MWFGIMLSIGGGYEYWELGDLIVNFGYGVAMIFGITASVSLALSIFFRELAEKGKSSTKTTMEKLFSLEKIRASLLNFIMRFFQGLTC